MARSKQENNEEKAEEGRLVLADGAVVPLQPMHPDCTATLQAFGAGLSVQSVYGCFFGFLPELTAEWAHIVRGG